MPWLPLFPLRTVLFPGTTIPLHIFEPRYREMIGLCLEKNIAFGVCLIREGEEVGGPALPHEVGTEAAVLASRRLPDGRYEIVAEGRRRFHIQELDTSRPFLSAEVSWIPEAPEDEAYLAELAEAVARLYGGLLARLDAMGRSPEHGESWKALSPAHLAYRVADTVPIAVRAKQDLLEVPTHEERLKREAVILMRLAEFGHPFGPA